MKMKKMKVKDPGSKKKQSTLGMYRFIGIIFTVLSLLNIIAVVIEFRSSGTSLFYAEEALSHMAKIEQHLQTTNECVLNIVINQNDPTIVRNEVKNIKSTFALLDQEVDTFRNIDTSNIDETIEKDFEAAMINVEAYRSLLEKIENYETKEIGAYYNSDIAPMKEKASSSMKSVADHQSQSTNVFFHKTAHAFLFLLLFMVFMLAVGLNFIKYMKKNAEKAELEIEENKSKASQFREKAIKIAYTNILTNLKNRYALERDLSTKLKEDSLTLAFFNFDNFNEITESYGRGFSDMFLVAVTDLVKERYPDKFEIFHTDTHEFCFLMNSDISRMDTEKLVNDLAQTLSAPVKISKLKINPAVSGCVYYYKPSEGLDTNALFLKIDRIMKELRLTNEHKITKIDGSSGISSVDSISIDSINSIGSINSVNILNSVTNL